LNKLYSACHPYLSNIMYRLKLTIYSQIFKKKTYMEWQLIILHST
jgi:hypothetical protein